MPTTNFPGSDNMFFDPMTQSIRRGLNISTAHRDICFARQGIGANELIMFNNYDAANASLFSIAGIRTNNETAAPVLSDSKEINYGLMGTKITGFKNAVIPIYDTTTTEFKLIFGDNLNRFYRGSYTDRANAVRALALAMHAYSSLTAVEATVTAYYNLLIGSGVTQHAKMADITGDSSAIFAQLAVCAGVMDQNLGYAKVINATNPDKVDRKSKIDSWFPLDMIQHHETTGFVENVLAGRTVFLGKKTFQPGDKVKVTIIGADLNIGTSPDRIHPAMPPTKVITFHSGVPVTIDPFASNWDLSQSNWMATNNDAANPSHVTFEFLLA